MNFGDIQETCFQYLGLQGTQRLDFRRQQVKDAINTIIDEITSANPFLFNLVRENTISVVAGTATYTLNDWLKTPLSVYTVDASAHQIPLRLRRLMDQDGSRNSNMQAGANAGYDAEIMRSVTAAVSGTSGASAVEGATSITSSGSTFDGLSSTYYDRMLRLNGEDSDYQFTLKATTTLTVDRAVRARLTGVGTANTGAGYSGVAWEVSPPGRVQIRFTPTPIEAQTVYYRGVYLPRRLVNLTDNPQILTEYHHLIPKGAIRLLSNLTADQRGFQSFAQEYSEAINMLRTAENDDAAVLEGPEYQSMLGGDPISWMSRVPRGVDLGRRW